MNVFSTLAPVFLIVALGVALRRTNFLSAEFFSGANRLVYWVGLPVLLFSRLWRAESLQDGWTAFLLALAGMAACLAAALVAAAFLRLPGPKKGAFLQGSFRANLAYVGLAVVSFAFPEPEAERASTLAIIVLAGLAPIYNVVAVVVLLAGRHRLEAKALARMGRSIVTNPIIIACVAGIGMSLSGVAAPVAVERTLGAVGRFALPIALLCIGGAIASTPIRSRAFPAFLAATIKVGVGPAVGVGLAWLIGAGPTETRVAAIMLACPAAVASYVLADQLGGDGPMAAGIVVASTILSAAALSLVVWLV